MIYETIVSTLAADGAVHLAPMGVHVDGERFRILPFRPSATLTNLQARPQAVINFCDDVRLFAGCLTGRRDWPCRPAEQIDGQILLCALSAAEVEVIDIADDDVRPAFTCAVRVRHLFRAFNGFNRAQFAVLEAAILVSRLKFLDAAKVRHDLDYLQTAIDKTAGDAEREAWGWLIEHARRYYQENPA
ncbi:MAG: DUF447 family protein [Methylococcales bacterium]|nr:DUF447 family protein [Methylococcales bacterium]